MKWFRVYSEIKDDPKMLEMDYDQRWLWLSIMAMSSESEDRGAICYTRPRGLAAALRIDEERLIESLALFQELGMVELAENRISITNWDNRQYDKPSDTPEATRDRKRRSRARHANSKPNAADVTPSHATDTDTDTDTEETRGDIAGSPPAETPAALVDAYCQIRGQPFPEDAGPFINIGKGLIRRGYTSADVEGCTRYMLSDDYWRADGRMTFKSLAGNLPDWVQNGRPERAASDRASPTDAAWQAIDSWTPDEEQVAHAK